MLEWLLEMKCNIIKLFPKKIPTCKFVVIIEMKRDDHNKFSFIGCKHTLKQIIADLEKVIKKLEESDKKGDVVPVHELTLTEHEEDRPSYLG